MTIPDTSKMVSRRLLVRVYYEDTDAAGIIYHPNYLKFAERGRSEFLRALDWPPSRVHAEFGVTFVVRHIEIDYLASGKLDDLLELETSIVHLGTTSLQMHQILCRGETIVSDMKVTLVAVNEKGRPTRFPPPLRHILTS